MMELIKAGYGYLIGGFAFGGFSLINLIDYLTK